ncbi:hypothetical protein TgHK011_003463 [Trichoderma gracile]|nr:hypothetical protein TgHK011_003463 [Trichoderma gracile]
MSLHCVASCILQPRLLRRDSRRFDPACLDLGLAPCLIRRTRTPRDPLVLLASSLFARPPIQSCYCNIPTNEDGRRISAALDMHLCLLR